MDLLNLVKTQLTDSVIKKISTYLGESTTSTTSALNSAMPAILGGIMQKASTTDGAKDLMGQLQSGGYNSNLLTNMLDNMLGNSEHTANLAASGSSILSNIFGNKAAALTNIVSEVSGLRQRSTSSLLNIAAPILMGVIGKQFTSQNMGLSGLTNLLMSQKDSVKNALPAGMGNILKINSLGNFIGNTPSMSDVMNSMEDSGNTMKKWLPWVLLAALLAGALFFWKGCQNSASKVGTAIDSTAQLATSVVDSATAKVATVADSAASKVKSGIAALGEFFKRKLPNGIELNIPQNGIENNLIKFIEDGSKPVDKTTWFNFDRILFDTGKATLTPESKEQIANIGEILKAYPDVTFKIGGYTDSTGKESANMKLSKERANSVMNAIVKEGIAAKRLTAEGYGSQFSVASNATEEGRAQNRRISVRVTKK